MTRRTIATGNEVIAAQALVVLAEQGPEVVVNDRIRALAAGRRIPGTEDDYEVIYEDQPA